MSALTPEERRWLYFGCHGDSGHYLWDAQGWRVSGKHPLSRFDGSLCLPKAVGQRMADHGEPKCDAMFAAIQAAERAARKARRKR